MKRWREALDPVARTSYLTHSSRTRCKCFAFNLPALAVANVASCLNKGVRWLQL